MPGSGVVRAAILQAKWTGDTASMIEIHETYAREAAQQGAKIMGFQEVFNAPYFCQVQEAEHYRWAEPVPDGPTVTRMQALARETGHGARGAGVRDRERRQLLQHGRGDRRRRHAPRQVPQAPHPAGQGLLGEVLLQARQPRLAGVRHRGRHASASTSATTGTSPRAGARSGLAGAAGRVQPVAPPAAGCRRTCGSWSSRPPRWRTSTSSPRSTGSASRSTATTTSTAPATSSTRAASSSATSRRDTRRNCGPRPGPRHDRRGAADRGRSTATAVPTPTDGLRANRDRRTDRPASPATGPSCPSWLATLLRRADRARARRGPARLGRRRQPLPRLLRRHPHHDDRARAARGHRGGRRAGRARCSTRSTLYLNRPMVELAERDRRARRASPTPRSSSRRRAPRPTRRRCCWPRRYRRSNQVLALRNSYHGRSFRTIAITGNRAWSPTRLSPFQTLLRARRLPLPQPVRAT